MHTTTAKIYKKNHQTLSEVIRIVAKFNAAQQPTTMLTPSTVSIMSNNDRCFVYGQTVILAALMHSVTAMMNSATLHKTAPIRSLPQ